MPVTTVKSWTNQCHLQRGGTEEVEGQRGPYILEVLGVRVVFYLFHLLLVILVLFTIIRQDLPCSLGWFQTYDAPASATSVLEPYDYTMTLSRNRFAVVFTKIALLWPN